MASNEKQKQSLYFPDEMLREIMREANRLDRSLSWTVQQAWRLAREGVSRFPAAHLPPSPRRADAPRAVTSAPLVDEQSVEASDQLRAFLKGKFERDVG